MAIDTEYEPLASRLEDLGIVTSLAELHGSLCGTMCAEGVAAAGRWLDECLVDWRLADAEEVGSALRNLELDTWHKLTSLDLGFEPLLPGDDEPLDAQVRGLALWCHGFLVGLGLGGYGADGAAHRRSEAVDEITKDFAELSRAVLDEEAEEPREAGFALEELKEYVRVSVQLVFEECGARVLSPGSEQRLH